MLRVRLPGSDWTGTLLEPVDLRITKSGPSSPPDVRMHQSLLQSIRKTLLGASADNRTESGPAHDVEVWVCPGAPATIFSCSTEACAQLLCQSCPQISWCQGGMHATLALREQTACHTGEASNFHDFLSEVVHDKVQELTLPEGLHWACLPGTGLRSCSACTLGSSWVSWVSWESIPMPCKKQGFGLIQGALSGHVRLLI